MKYIFCTIVFLISISSYSQAWEDSTHVVELKKQLGTATGTAKVDILNDLAFEYSWYRKQKDSTAKYQKWAYDEAQQLNYKHGLAIALLRQPGTDDEKKRNSEKAFQIATQTNDHEVLGWYYYAGTTGRKAPEEQIENFKKSVEYFRKAGLIEEEAEVSTWLVTMLVYGGKYEDAFPYAERNLKIAHTERKHNKGQKHSLIEHSYTQFAELYKVAGDFPSAIAYLQKARAYNQKHNLPWSWNPMLAHLYNQIGKPDSAVYYLKDIKNPVGLITLGETYIVKKDFQKAMSYINQAIDSILLPREKPYYWNNDPFLMGAYHVKSKAYLSMKNYDSALESLRKSDSHATITNGGVIEQMDKWKIYSDIYHNLGNNDSAYHYLNKYTTTKDSVQDQKMLWRLNLQLHSMQSAAIEAKKNADLALKEQKLKQELFIRNSLIAGLFFLLLIGFFILRNLHLKRKNEKLKLEKDLEVHKLQSEQKQTELQRQATELEMQALRAQMNPHFIFNCLSSINRFIIKNEAKTASNYLIRFSRLIRMVLMNSQKRLITLEDELQMLRLYLEMERMRFKNAFEYSITFLNEIDADNTYIPPLLLQPFCENAIWHGLMHLATVKRENATNGRLNIELNLVDDVLHCTIKDNGVGRSKAEELKSKTAEREKSMGIKITTERLSLINNGMNVNTWYEIEDMHDETGSPIGTRVQLKIKAKESIELYATTAPQ